MDTFKGFLRPDGSAGVRNHVAVIPTVSWKDCSSQPMPLAQVVASFALIRLRAPRCTAWNVLFHR